MSALIACQCRRTAESCKRLATQEDFLCDGCRAGCSVLSIGELTVGAATGAPGPAAKEMTVFDHHARVEFDGLTFGTLHTPRGPEIDFALPGIQGPADTRTSPPNVHTSPHTRNADPTGNPRNEGQ